LTTERTTPAALPTRPRASNPQPTRAERLRTVPPRPSESGTRFTRWATSYMVTVLRSLRTGQRHQHPSPCQCRIINRQAANRRRTPCNQTAATDTQQQQTRRSEALSKDSRWSGDGDACVHTAVVRASGWRRGGAASTDSPTLGRWTTRAENSRRRAGCGHPSGSSEGPWSPGSEGCLRWP
jgi:hypothetical protein